MPPIPQNNSYTASIPVRIPFYIWIGLILVMGILFTIEPLYSTIILILLLYGSVFVIASLSNVRLALILILLVALFFPVKLFIYTIVKFFLVDICMAMSLGLLLILWSKSAMKGKFRYQATPLDNWFKILLLLVLINSIISQDFYSSVRTWQHFLFSGPLIFLMVYNCFTTGPQIRRAYAVIIIAMIFTGAYLFIEHNVEFNPIYHKIYLAREPDYNPFAMYYRAFGFCSNPIFCGIAIAAFAPFMIFGMQSASGLKRRLFWGIASLIFILGGAAVNARGTAIALIAVIILMNIRSLKSLMIAIALLIVLIVVVIKSGLVTSIILRFQPEYLMADISLWHRILMLWSGFNIFMDYPILGAGMGSIWKLYAIYGHSLDVIGYKGVDNQFMTILYGTGIIGSIIFGGIMIKIPHYILKYRRQKKSVLINSFRKAGFISIIALYINSLTGDPFDWIYNNLPFWFINALIMRLITLPTSEIAEFFRFYGYNKDFPEFKEVEEPSKT